MKIKEYFEQLEEKPVTADELKLCVMNGMALCGPTINDIFDLWETVLAYIKQTEITDEEFLDVFSWIDMSLIPLMGADARKAYEKIYEFYGSGDIVHVYDPYEDDLLYCTVMKPLLCPCEIFFMANNYENCKGYIIFNGMGGALKGWKYSNGQLVKVTGDELEETYLKIFAIRLERFLNSKH